MKKFEVITDRIAALATDLDRSGLHAAASAVDDLLLRTATALGEMSESLEGIQGSDIIFKEEPTEPEGLSVETDSGDELVKSEEEISRLLQDGAASKNDIVVAAERHAYQTGSSKKMASLRGGDRYSAAIKYARNEKLIS